MAFYPDLAPFPELRGQARAFAVGWLDAEHPYAQGPLLPGFGEAISALTARPWQPFATAGVHFCPFCRISRTGGSGLLLVPSGERVYVAPVLALHYADCHVYAPPLEFQQAVLACPEMRSMPYLKALRAAGVTPRGA